MKQGIRDLLMSNNTEDVELGIIIAKKENIDIKEIDKLTTNRWKHEQELWFKLFCYLFDKYFEWKTDERYTSGGYYSKWREGELTLNESDNE